MNKNQMLKSLNIAYNFYKQECTNLNHEHTWLEFANEYVNYLEMCKSLISQSVAFNLGKCNLENIVSLLYNEGNPNLPYLDIYEKIPYPIIYIYNTINNKEILTLIMESSLFKITSNYNYNDNLNKYNITRIGNYIIIPIEKISIKNYNWYQPYPIQIIPHLSINNTVRHLCLTNEKSKSIVEQEIEEAKGLSIDRLCQTLFFLKLLSCKNIIIKDESYSKQNKKGYRPELDYKTIHIKVPGKKYLYNNKEYESIPFHEREKFGMIGQKRGHFKSYTEDAPLFGKHVGTWFWSPIFDISNKRNYEIIHNS